MSRAWQYPATVGYCPISAPVLKEIENFQTAEIDEMRIAATEIN